MSNPNTRLKEVFKELPVTYDSIADESGISKSTWQRATSEGGHIGIDILIFLANNYDVDTHYIVKGEYTKPVSQSDAKSTSQSEGSRSYKTPGSIEQHKHQDLSPDRLNEEGLPWDPEEFVVVPFYYEVYASAGHGRVTEHEKFVDMAFRKRFFNSTVYTDFRNCLMIRMKGDSMHPMYPDGCELLIDEARRKIKDGPGYIITIGDEVYCKLIRKLPNGKIELQSLNEIYKPMILDPEEEGFHIVGQVIWHAQTSKYI